MYTYSEVKTCSAGLVTFSPAFKGVPLFSSITFASASGVSNSTSVTSTIVCGISSISTDNTSISFNCVTNAGVLLGGNTFSAADNKQIRCFIFGKENPAVIGLLTQSDIDGVFHKV